MTDDVASPAQDKVVDLDKSSGSVTKLEWFKSKKKKPAAKKGVDFPHDENFSDVASSVKVVGSDSDPFSTGDVKCEISPRRLEFSDPEGVEPKLAKAEVAKPEVAKPEVILQAPIQSQKALSDMAKGIKSLRD